eukprot:TRINITY_DN66964_c7_g1_i3.p1 TRINITY_DN66964_c7_g1~~TRINITY_DN66964_c7_g1_i3.p1  ORF type:complete len:302 (-),score=35.33 TRINITY_DN66964_c7_g1_i3:27-932(-)
MTLEGVQSAVAGRANVAQQWKDAAAAAATSSPSASPSAGGSPASATSITTLKRDVQMLEDELQQEKRKNTALDALQHQTSTELEEVRQWHASQIKEPSSWIARSRGTLVRKVYEMYDPLARADKLSSTLLQMRTAMLNDLGRITMNHQQLHKQVQQAVATSTAARPPVGTSGAPATNIKDTSSTSSSILASRALPFPTHPKHHPLPTETMLSDVLHLKENTEYYVQLTENITSLMKTVVSMFRSVVIHFFSDAERLSLGCNIRFESAEDLERINAWTADRDGAVSPARNMLGGKPEKGLWM